MTGLWYKIFSMTIELAGTVEEQLRDLATRQGRAIDALLEEAVLQYLEAAAITDLSDEQVAETQLALMGEFRLRGTPCSIRSA